MSIRSRAVRAVEKVSPTAGIKKIPKGPVWGGPDVLDHIDEFTVYGDTGNCGLFWEADIGSTVISAQHAYALRKFIANERMGALCCSTTQNQKKQAEWLLDAGFEKLFSFINPKSKNIITVWAALALKD